MLKTQLAIAINFISSKGNDEECVMHSKSYNTEFIIYDSADEVIEIFFQSLLSRFGLDSKHKW